MRTARLKAAQGMHFDCEVGSPWVARVFMKPWLGPKLTSYKVNNSFIGIN